MSGKRAGWLFVVVLGLGTSAAPGTEYYVNATTGDDAYTGMCELYVPSTCNPDCCGPKRTIAAGIAVATQAGDSVVVAPGVYTGAGNRDIEFPGRALTVRSAYGPETCVIDCEGTPPNRHRGFFFLHNDAPRAAIIDGFTIFNGRGSDGAQTAKDGGAIQIVEAHPTVKNCILRNNAVEDASGGAIFAWKGANPLISHNFIRNNEALGGGGIRALATPSGIEGHLEITDSVIRCNAAEGGGGGVLIDGINDVWLKRSILAENEADFGGGLYVFGELSLPRVANIQFLSNRSLTFEGGGAFFFVGGEEHNDRHRVFLANSVFSGNSTPHNGGGLWIQSNIYPLISQCAFAYNTAGGVGGGIGFFGSDVRELSNSIVYFNSTTSQQAPQIYDEGNAAFLRYTDIQGGWFCQGCSGTGNYNLNPLFIADAGPDSDPDTWQDNNYRVTASSPTIDRNATANFFIGGDESDVDDDGDTAETLPWDLDRLSRVHNDIVDTHAFEFQVECPAANGFSASPPSGTIDARRPHHHAARRPRQGIGDPAVADNHANAIRITLSGTNGGAAHVSCWNLCETGAYAEPASGGFAAEGPNRITEVVHLGNDVYRVNLLRAITAGAVTTIRYARSSSEVRYIFQPGNVDGPDTGGSPSSTDFSNGDDVTRLIACLGQNPLAYCNTYVMDINQSGGHTAADVLALIDLLNGAAELLSVNGLWKPTGDECAVATCVAGADGGLNFQTEKELGGGDFVASQRTGFAEEFASYLAIVTPGCEETPAQLSEILVTIARWAGTQITTEQRDKLVEMLADQSMSFAAESVAKAVPDIVAALGE